MINTELMKRAQDAINKKNETVEELELRKEEIENQLDDLSEKLKGKEATADFAKFKKTRSEYADTRAYLDLIDKQIVEAKTVTPEEQEEIVNLLRELDRQILAVNENTQSKLSAKADEIMKIIEEAGKIQSEYYHAEVDLKMNFGINNFGSAMSTYNVYQWGVIRDVYNGFKRMKEKYPHE